MVQTTCCNVNYRDMVESMMAAAERGKLQRGHNSNIYMQNEMNDRERENFLSRFMAN